MASLMITVMLAYLGLVAFFMYFCMIADPETSAVARFLSETIPDKCWSLCKRILGSKNIKVVEWCADRAMILIYCVVVFGSWSIIFNYVYPWISNQSYVSQYHKYIGYLVFGSCVVSWRYASTSSPGIITKQTLSWYDHYPYDHLMFVPNKKCPTRHIVRLPRSKFDRYKYNENVPRFDHFCGWVFNTIGEENYRWFLLFLAVHVGMCTYGTVILTCLFYGHVIEKKLHTAVLFNRATGQEVEPGNVWILSQYLFTKFLMPASVLLLMAVMAVCLGLFLCYHIWITSRGLTTNECFKWDEIKKWYQTEKKRYQKALNDGTLPPPSTTAASSTSTPPVVSDGDVTCTGQQPSTGAAANNSNEENGDKDKDDWDAIVDPGPPPVNIYNRGFLENWKEVIFPISIQRRLQFEQAKQHRKAQ